MALPLSYIPKKKKKKIKRREHSIQNIVTVNKFEEKETIAI